MNHIPPRRLQPTALLLCAALAGMLAVRRAHGRNTKSRKARWTLHT